MLLSDTWYDNPSQSADTSQFSASRWPVRWSTNCTERGFPAFVPARIRLKTVPRFNFAGVIPSDDVKPESVLETLVPTKGRR